MEIESPNSNRTKRSSDLPLDNTEKSPKASENAAFGPSTMLNINKRAQESAAIINDNMITDILDGTTTVPNEPKTLFGFFSYIFSPNTKKDNENDIDDDMFDAFVNSINQMPQDEVCKPLPDVKKSGGYTVNDIVLGQQIYIKNDDNIYIIKEINENKQTITIQQIENNSIIKENIPISDIDNIINFNPESLHINQNFIDKINRINPSKFDDNINGLILKIKYYRTKIIICKIKIKLYQNNTDKLDALNNENLNLINYTGLLNQTIKDLTNIGITQRENDITKFFINVVNQFRSFYGIGALNNALDFFNNITFKIFLPEENKDSVIRKYITMLDIISIIGVAGTFETIGLITQLKNPLNGRIITTTWWIYSGIKSFIAIIPNGVTTAFLKYGLLPCIGCYVIGNFDTIFLVGTTFVTKTSTFFQNVLCAMGYLNDEYGIEEVEDDQATVNSIITSVSITSTGTMNTINTIITKSTFDLKSIESLYQTPILVGYNQTPILVGYSDELTNDLKLITQNNSVLESSQASQASLASTISSQNSYGSPPQSPERGGKNIKRSRITKKHKRITIRRSKRSKKMKGGKRTRTTKKRRVVRRRKHNTKKY